MKELTNKELMDIDGGAGITGTFLNSMSRAITTVMDAGRYLGSSLRRLFSGNLCSF